MRTNEETGRSKRGSPTSRAVKCLKRVVVGLLCFAMVASNVPSTIAFAAEGTTAIESDGFVDDEITLDDAGKITVGDSVVSVDETSTGTNDEADAESDPDEEGAPEEEIGEVTDSDEEEGTSDPDETAGSEEDADEEGVVAEDEGEGEEFEDNAESEDGIDVEEESSADKEPDGEEDNAAEAVKVENGSNSAAISPYASPVYPDPAVESGSNALNIYKYTSGETGIATLVDEITDNNVTYEAFWFTSDVTGKYYVAYELSGSYHFLNKNNFSADSDIENLYHISSFSSASSSISNIAEIEVVEGETYFINRPNALDAGDYEGRKVCLIEESKVSTVNTVPTDHLDETSIGHYAISYNAEPLADAEFILTMTVDGVIYYYAGSDDDVPEWTESKDYAEALVSGDDGYIYLTGLAAGTYILTEIEAPKGYELLKDPITVTIPDDDEEEITEVSVENIASDEDDEEPGSEGITVSKSWDDADNQDGIRPESITIRLFADGEQIDAMAIDKSDGWTWTFSIYDAEDIKYSIEEDAVEGYEAEITGDAENGFVITNSHTPETIDISVSKEWNDEENQDGIRPESVTVTLLADGSETEVEDIELGETNNWADSFEDLPKYADGTQIEYTVSEINFVDANGANDTYTAEITGDVENGFVITNTHTPETEPEPEPGPETGDSALDIFKYTSGSGLAVQIDSDDPDADLTDEAFLFTAAESGTYYIAYETNGGSSYHFLRSSDFSADAEVENLYYGKRLIIPRSDSAHRCSL